MNEVSEDGLASKIWFLKHLRGALREKFLQVPDSYFLMHEFELENHFRRSHVDYFLRKRFHEELEKIKGTDEFLSPINVYSGVCVRHHFYNRFLHNPHRIAWICIPVATPDKLLEDGFHLALTKVRNEILTLPVSEKTAPIILKALDFFALRFLGPVVQRIEQKNMNVNFNTDVTAKEVVDPEALLRKYSEAKSKLLRAPNVNIDDIVQKQEAVLVERSEED
jgi:hypothetical protein